MIVHFVTTYTTRIIILVNTDVAVSDNVGSESTSTVVTFTEFESYSWI